MLSISLFRSIRIMLVLALPLLGYGDPIDTAAWAEGRALFKANCASCHHPTIAQTGPALIGVTARWDSAGSYQGRTGRQWLYDWIRNWNAPVTAGYPYAVMIQNYSPTQMNLFPGLTDHQIDAILLYVESSPIRAAEPADTRSGSGLSLPYIAILILSGLIILALALLLYIRAGVAKMKSGS
jgi:mono/diheme cytochrome c family protein